MNIFHETMNGFEVVRISGRLDAVSVRDEREALTQIADNPGKGMVLNMQAVDFIDSSGLGLIVSLVKRSREQQSDLSICCLTPQAQSLFELTRMTRIFVIHPTEADAIKA